MEFAVQPIEPDPSSWVPILGDLLFKQPQKVRGQYERETPLFHG